MKRTYHPESGNALWFILLAVVLLTALAVVITRTSSTTEQTGSYERGQVEGSDIMRYAVSVEQAISRLRMDGASENDISFASPDIAGYGTPGTKPTSEVFYIRGGGLVYKKPPSTANGGADWIFSGANSVVGVGTDGTGTTSSTDNELMMILPNINLGLCNRINAELKIAGTPPPPVDVAPVLDTTTLFNGTFPNGSVIEAPAGVKSACIQSGGLYYFYYVLIAR